MIEVADVLIQYGDRILLDHVTFSFQGGEKIGLVGRNGVGKTTLLKLISGQITPDSGKVHSSSNIKIGYLEQILDHAGDVSVFERAQAGYEELNKIKISLSEIENQIAARTDYESSEYYDLLNKNSEFQDEFKLLGGYSMDKETEAVLSGLGFENKAFDKLVDHLSGGWKMRVELAKILLSKPDFLLLDEPTNHLDIESIIWLEKYLKASNAGILLISHDRQFLDNVTNRTLEIELGGIHDYKCAYSAYLVQRTERRTQLESAFKNQQKAIQEREKTIKRFMAKATKTKMAQSMQKQLNKMDRIALDVTDDTSFSLRFREAPRSGAIVLKGSNISKSYGALDVLRAIDIEIERGDKVAFIGQNGQGKSTLVKILLESVAADEGDIAHGHNTRIGYYAQDQSDSLDSKMTVLESMYDGCPEEMRTKVRSILGGFLFSGEDVDKKVLVLSGGEKARLAMAKMLLKPINVLVMDEPTNHLDMLSKEVLKGALRAFDGTLLVVSHDRDFLGGLTQKMHVFRQHKIHEFLGDIDDYLKHQEIENIREVEKRNQKTASTISEPKKASGSMDREERRQIERVVKRLEKKIENLETKIGEMESEMALPDFYKSDDAQNKITAYESLKADLQRVYAEWEAESERLS